jgi:hypothetical protein
MPTTLPTISRSMSRCFLESKLPERARSIQKQPIIGGGMFGGIGARRRHEIAEITGLFPTISNPSRGATLNKHLAPILHVSRSHLFPE